MVTQPRQKQVNNMAKVQDMWNTLSYDVDENQPIRI